MVGVKQFIAGAAVLVGAQGVPAAPALATRGEGVHLFNCSPWSGAGVPQTWVSLVVYCANDSDCSNPGYSPPGNNVCVKSTSSVNGKFHIWEDADGSGSQSCTFPSGVTFKWDIENAAQWQETYAYIGPGSNNYRQFQGYLDDKTNGISWNYHSCQKIYYFL